MKVSMRECIYLSINLFICLLIYFALLFFDIGMLKEKEIIIQGHLALEVEMYLISTYDMPKHLISSKVLKGVKPKKK